MAPVLVRQKRGESKEQARDRASKLDPKSSVIVESFRAGGERVLSGKPITKRVLNEFSSDKTCLIKAINEVRKPWGSMISKAIGQCQVAQTVSPKMSVKGGIKKFFNPSSLMTASEKYLGSSFQLDDEKTWHIAKYYNIVSNLECAEWMRGTTAGVTFEDSVSFGDTDAKTVVTIDRSEFAEVRRLCFGGGEVVTQDHAEADRLAKALKFPKSREGLTPVERQAVTHIAKRAEMGQNHLTRLVRGVMLALAADMVGGSLTLKKDLNKMKWVEYTPKVVSDIYNQPDSTVIWCNQVLRPRYASILGHFTQEWSCDELPLRIKNLTIPAEGAMTYIIGLGKGDLSDVVVTSADIRGALACYAQSMAIEDVLDKAYCVGSMLLLHEHWPAIHLPAVMSLSDLIRPAMATKHSISRHKREWTIREAMVISKYAVDALGLGIKEVMSSSWDHNKEPLTDVISKISRWTPAIRNELYRWLIENVCGEDCGFLFNLDPFNSMSEDVIGEVNDTSTLKYWYLHQLRQVGNDSICGALSCSVYTNIPSTGADTASARELGFLRQVGVLDNGPLYKRAIRMKKPRVDSNVREMVEGTLKEGVVSVVPSGLSLDDSPRRGGVTFCDWDVEGEDDGIEPFDDESDDDEGGGNGGNDDDGPDGGDDDGEFEIPEEDFSALQAARRQREIDEARRLAAEAERMRLQEEAAIRAGMERVAAHQLEKEARRVRSKQVRIETPPEITPQATRVVIEEIIEPEPKDREDEPVITKVVEPPKEKEVDTETGMVVFKPTQEWGLSEEVEGGPKSKTVLSKEKEKGKEKEKDEPMYYAPDDEERGVTRATIEADIEKESAYVRRHWMRRNLSPGTIEDNMKLMNEIFPSTSLSVGDPAKKRTKIIQWVGAACGFIHEAPSDRGKWDMNHFIIQAWAWRSCHKWLDHDKAQKISDIAKNVNTCLSGMKDRDRKNWLRWTYQKFSSDFSFLGSKDRAAVDQMIREKKGRPTVVKVCKILGLELPEWNMSDHDIKETIVLDVLGLFGH